jgi:fucose permease
MALAVSRFMSARLTDRLSPVALSASSAVLAGIGLFAAVLSPSLEASIVLFALVGFAFGPVFSTIIAAAGALYPDRASAVSGFMLAASLVGSMAYPPAMGLISDAVGRQSVELSPSLTIVVAHASVGGRTSLVDRSIGS